MATYEVLGAIVRYASSNRRAVLAYTQKMYVSGRGGSAIVGVADDQLRLASLVSRPPCTVETILTRCHRGQ